MIGKTGPGVRPSPALALSLQTGCCTWFCSTGVSYPCSFCLFVFNRKRKCSDPTCSPCCSCRLSSLRRGVFESCFLAVCGCPLLGVPCCQSGFSCIQKQRVFTNFLWRPVTVICLHDALVFFYGAPLWPNWHFECWGPTHVSWMMCMSTANQSSFNWQLKCSFNYKKSSRLQPTT